MQPFQPTFPVYGVEQSNHGHLYRWIFTPESWKSFSEGFDNHEFDENKTKWIDIGCPIGGSNSAATYIAELSSLNEVKGFLLSEYTTDYDDPTLVDIAESIYTIDTSDNYYGSITKKFVELFQIPENELTKDNSLYEATEKMIAEIKSFDEEEFSGIDYSNPFYGESSDMRYSELSALLDSYKAAKKGFYIEIAYDQQKQQVLELLSEKGYCWLADENVVGYGMAQPHMNYIHVRPLCDGYLQWRMTKPEEAFESVPVISGYDFVREPDLYFSKMQKPSEAIHM